MPLQVIEPRRLYRQVAEQIRTLIERGEYPAGTRLPTERELALLLGVSRPTVREALIALEVDGRVKIRVGSGIYVMPPSQRPHPLSSPPAGPFEILEARALIESALADAAAKAARPSHITVLDQIIAEMRGAKHPGQESIAIDRSFHVAIADILGNDAVTQIVGTLFDQRINPYFEQLARYFETPDSWTHALAEHVAVRDAIAAGDGQAAASAMRAHLATSQERFSKNFGQAAPAAPKGPNRSKKGVDTPRQADPVRHLASQKQTRRKAI